MFVYVVTNKVNGKRYVGQHSGEDLNKYWRNCVIHALNNRHGKNRLLYRAVRKYGPDSFKIAPLVVVSSKWEMDRYEIGMIAVWDLCNPEKGYNLAAGGQGTLGYKFSDEQLKRLSDSHKGIKQSDETKIKRSQSLIGQRRSEETKQRMSKAQMGNKARLGDSKSEEERQKLSQSLKGNKNALGAIRSPEYCKEKSESQKGRIISEEHRKKISDGLTRYFERRRNGNSVQHSEVGSS